MPVDAPSVADDSRSRAGQAATPPDAEGTADVRSRLLEAAARLICARGVGGTGIDSVLAEAGVAKATLYRAFGSKEGLVEAVLDRHSRQWSSWFMTRLASLHGSAETRLLGAFDLLAEWFASPEFRGCPILNAIGEGPEAAAPARRVAALHKARLAPALTDLARQAGADDPEALVEALLLLMDGAIVVAMATASPAPAATARQTFAALLRERLAARCPSTA